MINSYVKSFFFERQFSKIGIARAGNVIGGGDWSQGRIIPDCVKAWSKKKKCSIEKPKIYQTMAACFGAFKWLP